MSREYRQVIVESKGLFRGRRSTSAQAPTPAARVRVPNASSQHEVDVPGFHGTPKKIKGRHIRTSRTPSLPEPNGASFGTNPKTARQFGKHVYRARLRGKIGDAETFMARAREHMANGHSAEDASKKTQREFERRGYHGVRWGQREIAMFKRTRVRPHKHLGLRLAWGGARR